IIETVEGRRSHPGGNVSQPITLEDLIDSPIDDLNPAIDTRANFVLAPIQRDPFTNEPLPVPRNFEVPAGATNGPIATGGLPGALARPAAGPRVKTVPPTKRPQTDSETGTSEVELETGAVLETYDLVPYYALGQAQALQLRYKSTRADARPIVTVGWDDVEDLTAAGFIGERYVTANLQLRGDQANVTVAGYQGGSQLPVTLPNEHLWRVPLQGGPLAISIQANEMRDLPSGKYSYTVRTGFVHQTPLGTSSSLTSVEGELVHVNTQDSIFGAGWGISGLAELVFHADGSVLLIDGDGSELLFKRAPGSTTDYVSPDDEPSILRRRNGHFERLFPDRT